MTQSILFSYLMFLCFQINLKAQTVLSINGDFNKNALIINQLTFDKNSTINDYEKVLGKAERIEKIAGKDRIFAYDKLGISLSLKPNTTLVEEIYITYIFDGDKKVAKETFNGTLSVNGTAINNQTTYEQIGKQAKINLVIAMKGLYMSKVEGLNLIVYYPESTVGQFGFSFTEAN